MSATSIARQNRRMRHRQLPTLSVSSSVLPPNNLKLSSLNTSNDISTLCSEENTNSIQPQISTTGCSFITCDVSSQSIGKVFIEDERGFKIINENQLQTLNNEYPQSESLKRGAAISVAFKAAQIFHNLSHFCHGLLGGMSFIHLLLLIHFMSSESSHADTLRHFSFLSQPIHNIYNFACMICCISVFDRYDVANMKTLFKCSNKCFLNICLIIIYPVSLIMSLSTMNVDEKLWLPNTNYTQSEVATFKETTSELFYWKILSILKCVGAILAWILLCVNPNYNSFLIKLKDIYQRSTNMNL